LPLRKQNIGQARDAPTLPLRKQNIRQARDGTRVPLREQNSAKMMKAGRSRAEPSLMTTTGGRGSREAGGL